MTNGLGLFFAFYILVAQPALLGRMLDNCNLYELAGLNAGIFFIARIISAMCKPHKEKPETNTTKLMEKSEERVSRIENNNGVAIVEVEKKTEVVVTPENKVQEEDIEKEENTEENLENRSEEKPMREGVTIPKIVQPLAGHQTPKKRKRERKWGQRLILLLTLGVAAVIARTLREFLENRGIAIALFLGWILYLVIGKLFDVNGFFNAKKLFTNRLYIILILAGIGYAVYTMQQENQSLLPSDFTEKVTSYVKNWFKTDKENKSESEVNTGNIIYVFEGTGEVITDTDIEDSTSILDETGSINNNEIEAIENTELTGTTDNIEPEVEIQPEPTIEDQTTTLSPEEAKKQVTMGEAIKSILAGATLSTKTNISFKYVSKSNELYPYFKTAQERGMIGTDTDPNKLVSCDTYITMKGLREGRDVGSYSKNNVKAVYWSKAEQLGKLNGCQKGKYVTKGNL